MKPLQIFIPSDLLVFAFCTYAMRNPPPFAFIIVGIAPIGARSSGIIALRCACDILKL